MTDIVLVDSLEKVFPDAAPRPFDPTVPLTLVTGERANLQVAIHVPAAPARVLREVVVRVRATHGVRASLSQVELVDVRMPYESEIDPSEFLRTEPGLFPDLLRPLADEEIVPIVPGRWHAIWVSLEADADAAPAGAVVEGGVRVEVDLLAGDASTAVTEQVVREAPIEVVGAQLPQLGLVNTHWFHGDGIAQFYGVEVLSEPWWHAVGEQMRAAARMDVTSVLTPLWTPPLDTAEGGERLPTQLLEIVEEEPANDGDGRGARYTFGFDALDRWLGLARAAGIRQIEVPHLFTQWGARATPAIRVRTAAGEERRFGWDVPATDPSYRALMEQLLPALIAHLDEAWGLDDVLFHLSDEPNHDHLDSYTAARGVVADLLEGVRVVDALSDYAFYERGLVPTPIVATDHVQAFLDAGVENVWVYYCMAQKTGVANRFIAQPSASNRVLGRQLFAARAGGFLHWGFNFYNTQFSRRPLNPFLDTCAGGGFPGGDPFIVYPGPGGAAWLTIRYEVFAEAMLDHRIAQALTDRIGHEAAAAMLAVPGTDAARPYALPPQLDPVALRRTAREAARALVEG